MRRDNYYMNKKAASLLLMLYEIIVVIVVVGIAFAVSTRLVKEETLLKTNAAEDFAMMLNVMLGMPGDVFVEYPRDLSKFMVALLPENAVGVYEKDKSSDKDPVKRTYILPAGYSAVGFVKQKANICLKKEGKTIAVVECPKP